MYVNEMNVNMEKQKAVLRKYLGAIKADIDEIERITGRQIEREGCRWVFDKHREATEKFFAGVLAEQGEEIARAMATAIQLYLEVRNGGWTIDRVPGPARDLMRGLVPAGLLNRRSRSGTFKCYRCRGTGCVEPSARRPFN